MSRWKPETESRFSYSPLFRYLAHKKWNKTTARVAPNWWHVPRLAAYVDGRIEAAAGTKGSDSSHESPRYSGVAAALMEFLGQRTLGSGISIACGNGSKERKLMHAGLVKHFSLYEISHSLLEKAEAAAESEGLGACTTTCLGNAFSDEHPPYDLVYWDHALHHMMDVDAAVAWSVQALRPGGVLLVNDYVGPTRLQWAWAETRLAKKALSDIESVVGEPVRRPRRRTWLHRGRMIWRDPSEAPQSDRILSACRRHCNGFAPTGTGCAMINICGPYVAELSHPERAADRLIEWDRKADFRGMSHFAFGIWRKPLESRA